MLNAAGTDRNVTSRDAFVGASQVLFNICSLRPDASQDDAFLSLASSLAPLAQLLASHDGKWMRGSHGIAVVVAVALQCIRSVLINRVLCFPFYVNF